MTGQEQGPAAHEIQRLRTDLAAAYAVLKAIDEHVTGMESEIGDHQDHAYDVNDHDETRQAGHTAGRDAEHERITYDLRALLDNDAVRLATGVTCQPGQPWSCGDAHTAGRCVRTKDADGPSPLAAELEAMTEQAKNLTRGKARLASENYKTIRDLRQDVEYWKNKYEGVAMDQLAAPDAAPHTVWDHYGPCGYCGVTTGPCLNPDRAVPWPDDRRVPAPKPHPRRQVVAAEIDDLIARSSLGTPGAVALRAATDDARAARIVAQAAAAPQTDEPLYADLDWAADRDKDTADLLGDGGKLIARLDYGKFLTFLEMTQDTREFLAVGRCPACGGMDGTHTVRACLAATSPKPQTDEPCDSMNAHDPHDRCPGARSAFTDRYPSEDAAPDPVFCIAVDPDHAGMTCGEYDAALDAKPEPADGGPVSQKQQCDIVVPNGEFCRLVLHHDGNCDHKTYPKRLDACCACLNAPLYPDDAQTQHHVDMHRAAAGGFAEKPVHDHPTAVVAAGPHGEYTVTCAFCGHSQWTYDRVKADLFALDHDERRDRYCPPMPCGRPEVHAPHFHGEPEFFCNGRDEAVTDTTGGVQ